MFPRALFIVILTLGFQAEAKTACDEIAAADLERAIEAFRESAPTEIKTLNEARKIFRGENFDYAPDADAIKSPRAYRTREVAGAWSYVRNNLYLWTLKQALSAHWRGEGLSESQLLAKTSAYLEAAGVDHVLYASILSGAYAIEVTPKASGSFLNRLALGLKAQGYVTRFNLRLYLSGDGAVWSRMKVRKKRVELSGVFNLPLESLIDPVNSSPALVHDLVVADELSRFARGEEVQLGQFKQTGAPLVISLDGKEVYRSPYRFDFDLVELEASLAQITLQTKIEKSPPTELIYQALARTETLLKFTTPRFDQVRRRLRRGNLPYMSFESDARKLKILFHPSMTKPQKVMSVERNWLALNVRAFAVKQKLLNLLKGGERLRYDWE